ncbi:hypothetical protein DNTS_015246 [Danionella cerebrum]|uniref:G2 and S phase-expressed protein 1 N-terminal domain-containing protein n=1 Tax=Danionella cerebrum TaxID=2873325 RepID=A0A553MSF4_9TELE|nr:hypothetical protein DNTS_015246 [Danionella translucida]
MASLTPSVFVSLADEKFDFDISLSPGSCNGDIEVEDEVFMGPVGHKEKCISHGVESHMKESISSRPSLGEEPSWSPLSGEKFEEICKEAQLLVSHIEQTTTDSAAENRVEPPCRTLVTEIFENDSAAKLSMFSKPADNLSPIKRETFLVQDSPMKLLPPAIQKRMMKTNGTPGFGKPRLSTSSPVRPAVAQSKMASRSKALLGNSGVLPSKPIPQVNLRLSSSTKPPSATIKAALPPPRRNNFSLKRSPSSRNTSRNGSSEDLLSDTTTSVASDVSDSSFNTSLPGRASIPARSKTELRAPSAIKAPSRQNSKVVDRRRNTSSSSSSVSSINSSMTVSPGNKAKLNSSLNSSTSSVSARSQSMSRLPNSSRKSSVITHNPESGVNRRSSVSTQGRRTSELMPRPVKATPVKKTETPVTPQLQTPAKMGSVPRGNHKLKLLVAPTPINNLKGVRKSETSVSPEVPRFMKPKRILTTACSVDSDDTKGNEGQEDAELSKEEPCPPAELQPCSLLFNAEAELEEPPACEPAGVETPPESQSCDPEFPQIDVQTVVEFQKQLLQKNPEKSLVNEVLLVDAPAPAPHVSEKLLIDLSNTPDLIKTSSAKPWGEQLIDLSSPLIKWSPEDRSENTENVAPLIDLSF